MASHARKSTHVHRSIKPNAKVETFDALCEVQSDKASVEITSPFQGIVKQLLVQEGEIARVGQELCVIEVDDEVLGGETLNSPISGVAIERAEEAGGVDKRSAPVPEATKPSPVSEESPVPPRRHHPLDPLRPPSSPSKQASQPSTPSSSSTQFAPSPNTIATPSVRHFARKNGIADLSVVKGSGKNGRIEKVDVDQYLAKGAEASGASQSAGTTNAPSRSEEVQTLEMGRTRWAMYKAMTKVRNSTTAQPFKTDIASITHANSRVSKSPILATPAPLILQNYIPSFQS